MVCKNVHEIFSADWIGFQNSIFTFEIGGEKINLLHIMIGIININISLKNVYYLVVIT